jgi:hypothetical protein
MRAFRTLLILAVVLVGWAAWRYPAASSEFSALRKAASLQRPAEPELASLHPGGALPVAAAPSAASAVSNDQLRQRAAELEERLLLLDRLAFLESRIAALEGRAVADRAEWRRRALDMAHEAGLDDMPPRRNHRKAERDATADAGADEELALDSRATADDGGRPEERERVELAAVSNEQRAFQLADQGYRRLSGGDRREAAKLLREAASLSPGSKNAPAWRAQRAMLLDRWSADIYMMMRDTGGGDFDPSVAASPVLGGGQSGGAIAYKLNPLSPRPVAIEARASVAQRRLLGVDSETSQAALGVSWRPFAGLPLSVTGDRLIRVAPGGRNDWALRLAGGVERDGVRLPVLGRGSWSAYAEAGVIGISDRDSYAAAQARFGRDLFTNSRLTFNAGFAGWGSIQRTGGTVERLDVGPSLRVRLNRPASIEVSADYRLRALGNARPTSGPALTVSSRF